MLVAKVEAMTEEEWQSERERPRWMVRHAREPVGRADQIRAAATPAHSVRLLPPDLGASAQCVTTGGRSGGTFRRRTRDRAGVAGREGCRRTPRLARVHLGFAARSRGYDGRSRVGNDACETRRGCQLRHVLGAIPRRSLWPTGCSRCADLCCHSRHLREPVSPGRVLPDVAYRHRDRPRSADVRVARLLRDADPRGRTSRRRVRPLRYPFALSRDTSLTHVRGCWAVDLVLGKA
jgi:hypothetical protein